MIYKMRWHREVTFKELHSSLGLSDDQVLSKGVIERHLHQCSLAYQFLTHRSLQAVSAQT